MLIIALSGYKTKHRQTYIFTKSRCRRNIFQLPLPPKTQEIRMQQVVLKSLINCFVYWQNWRMPYVRIDATVTTERWKLSVVVIMASIGQRVDSVSIFSSNIKHSISDFSSESILGDQNVCRSFCVTILIILCFCVSIFIVYRLLIFVFGFFLTLGWNRHFI